jgi:DNA polymerase I-like protein with 3'-5' exonuclease and polymerase domains
MLQLEDCDTIAHDWYNKWYYNETNVNDYIPIVKHYERCSAMKDKFIESYSTFEKSESFDYYNELFIDNLYGIERNGLKVDYNKFVEKFQTNNLVGATTYTEYNIYTTTGRPSNKHGGVNYAAINKEDGSRESFISRHEYGMLLELDYDSYHLRLIGDIIDYELPETSVHTYLGKQYFGKDKLSKEEYEQSKTISFRLLYGGVDKDFAKIPFFGKVRDFTYKLWKEFQSKGYIETAVLKRKLFRNAMSDMNPSKLFNYYLQSMETEYNMAMINEVNALLGPYDTKLILYTYDSLLFDFNLKDGKQLILDIKNTMTNDKFPVKIKAGKTMQDMQNMTSKVG